MMSKKKPGSPSSWASSQPNQQVLEQIRIEREKEQRARSTQKRLEQDSRREEEARRSLPDQDGFSIVQRRFVIGGEEKFWGCKYDCEPVWTQNGDGPPIHHWHCPHWIREGKRSAPF